MIRRLHVCAPALLALLLAAFAGAAHGAEEFRAGSLTITEAWARASAGNLSTGSAYLTIRNRGADGDRLMAAESDVAARTELHTHVRDGEVMRMRPVEAIDLPPGRDVRFEPGGLHVMFFNLRAPFREGEAFPLALIFEKAGRVTVRVAVRPVGAMAPGGGSPGGHGAAPGMSRPRH